MKRKNTTNIKQRLTKIVYEENFDNEIWENLGDTKPTPQTHPDAFISYAVYPYQERVAKTRKCAPYSLSKSKLKKRLARCNLSSNAQKELLRKIFEKNESYANWKISDLKILLGDSVYKRVTKFLTKRMVILDEFGYYASSAFSELAESCRSMMRDSRKYNPTLMVATQSLEDFSFPKNPMKTFSVQY